MTDTAPPGAIAPLYSGPPELSYPGLSPQLLARVKQLWSARGLDFDPCWRAGIRSLPGFHAVPRFDGSGNSAAVDLVFLFDQALLWIRAMQAATAAGHAHDVAGLTQAQWHGLAGINARLTEQMSALRLLALTGLAMPAMQIARAISEDVDMALVLLIRPRLAQRFALCRNVEDTNDFWRRHIAGGRAFRAIAEKLYGIGIDHSADTDYAKWRGSVLTTLNTAVHSNILNASDSKRAAGKALLNDDSLYFATYRIHELCAYAQLVSPDLTDRLRMADAMATGRLAPLAAPMSAILISQIQSLNTLAAALSVNEEVPSH